MSQARVVSTAIKLRVVIDERAFRMRTLVRALATWWALLMAPFAARALDDTRIDTARKAADAVLTLFERAPVGRRPRLDDPAVRAKLEIVFDRSLFASPIPVSQSEKIDDLLENANRVGLAYYYDGADPGDDGRADANVAIYGPEIGAWLDYQVAADAGRVGGLYEFAARKRPQDIEDQTDRSGLHPVRLQTARIASNILLILLLPDVTDEWRLARLSALLASSDVASRFLAEPMRRQLQDTARDVESRMTDPGVKKQLSEYARRISRAQ